MKKAIYHLPGLFEFFSLYSEFLPLYRDHGDWFYPWCEIGSIYGAPEGCIWGGGRTGSGNHDPKEVLHLLEEHNISARLTFSNSLLTQAHLADAKCNYLCQLLQESSNQQNQKNQSAKKTNNGVIVHSDLLSNYIQKNYPDLYLVSSTTKVLVEFDSLKSELEKEEFSYVVPDFRLNKSLDQLSTLPEKLKDKVELLCNECCWTGCTQRKMCYENVSRKNLDEECPDHICRAPDGNKGYLFSKAMENSSFIGIEQILSTYLPMGFSNFKIEGRELGSALVLEFLLYYMTKPEHQLKVRESIYLDSMLDLF